MTPPRLSSYYDKSRTDTLVSHGILSHQQSRASVSESGPQRGFGVLVPGERRTDTIYNQTVNSQSKGDSINPSNQQAWVRCLGTVQESAHSSTSTPRLQVASTSTAHVHAPPGTSQPHNQTDQLASQHRQLLRAILPRPPSIQCQGQQPAPIAASNLPYRCGSATPNIPNWSTPAELEAAMAAFRKLHRQEKIARLTMILTSIHAKHPEKITPPTRESWEHGIPVGARRRATRQGDERIENVARAMPSGQVHLPELQQQMGVSGSGSGMGEVTHHPGYSNVKCAFEAPSFDSVKNVPGAQVQVKEEGEKGLRKLVE